MDLKDKIIIVHGGTSGKVNILCKQTMQSQTL
jgi:hypothetical protein